MNKPSIALLNCLCLSVGFTSAFGATSEAVEQMPPASESAVLIMADSVGLKEDFQNLYRSKSDAIRYELAEARTLRHLWQAEFELRRILLEIEEESAELTLAIKRIENKQVAIANSLDSINFLSTSIIALIGNCIFIPAPPPRPKVPNILFSTANGISTGLSVLSLAAITKGGRASITRESMLAPLFASSFTPNHSGRVWRYLTWTAEPGVEIERIKLLNLWKTRFALMPNPDLHSQEMRPYGLSANSQALKLSALKARLEMLEDLQDVLLKMSRTLSDLSHHL